MVVGVDWWDMVSVYDELQQFLTEERGFYIKKLGWGKYYFDERVVLLRNPNTEMGKNTIECVTNDRSSKLEKETLCCHRSQMCNCIHAFQSELRCREPVL